jgi:hypothetical protein
MDAMDRLGPLSRDELSEFVRNWPSTAGAIVSAAAPDSGVGAFARMLPTRQASAQAFEIMKRR